MNRYLLFLWIPLLLTAAGDAAGQAAPVSLGSIQQPVRVTMGGSYQRVADNGRSVTEASFPLSIYVPAGRDLALSILAYGVSAGGRDLTSVSGMADVVATAHYARPIGNASFVASLAANIPSGPELTAEEFATSIFLGQNYYGFHLQSLGQGFNVAPSLTIAIPAAEGVALGIGVGYQMRGSYTPAAGFDEPYRPGNELLLTSGIDLRLGSAAVLSSDLTVALYSRDRIGDVEVYDPGQTMSITTQLRTFPGNDEMRTQLRYRKRSGGQLVIDDVMVPVARQAVPDQLETRFRYDSALDRHVRMGLLIQARHFSRSQFSRPLTVADAGLAPALSLGRALTLHSRLMYTIGSFTGLEVGVGLTASY